MVYRARGYVPGEPWVAPNAQCHKRNRQHGPSQLLTATSDAGQHPADMARNHRVAVPPPE